MPVQTTCNIPNGDDELSAVIHLPDSVPAPVVVCCHGLLSAKVSPKYVEVGEKMSAAGFAVLRFDFSGCGDSPARKGPLIGNRSADLRSVLDFIEQQSWFRSQIGLLGSSMGGYLSLLAARDNPGRIGAVACWAAPYDLTRINPDGEGNGKNAQKQETHGGVAGQGGSGHGPAQSSAGGEIGDFQLGGPLDLGSLDAVEKVLVIHGRLDEIVPWEHSVEIYKRLADPKELMLFETADHRFTDPEWRSSAIRASLDWFGKYIQPT